MKELTVLEKLDYILRTIHNKSPYQDESLYPHLKYGDLSGIIKESDYNITLNEVRLILEKLEKDGYIVSKPVKYQEMNAPFDEPKSHIGYSSTFEGAIFLEKNAYVGQEERHHAENIRVATLEKNQKTNANRMTYLTIVIAFGTLIAAAYYLIEIIDYFCHH